MKHPRPDRTLTQLSGFPDPRPGREAEVAVVALGSNLGDRGETLERAAERLRRLPLVEEVRMSAPIETVAVHLGGPDPDAPRYLNAVALVTTRLAPEVLLGMLHAVEEEEGRVRRERWGDRTLDLDLIAYGSFASDEPHLHVPHPRAAERLFVLEPWLSLDPDAVLPGRGRVSDLVTALHADDDAENEGSAR
ncbi:MULTISPECIES: 2-amino-4-hydroxy-6-hydroxymethyldihydropteridine diphosphokinase [unclassified Microbacterium]|uniref:2-amino-4-hydroxy-6- hydroxymethyldihydropteridine diphosphokinase n=1 Tax=unclassified Microbacterium TaxID=2609290 RepID=UPI0012F8E157|nr:2-amino-4-hydroxy-6-hydroxymethyldihydropteridine diphosphokinase [Microbacterium sp. MAH-37]MVQ40602.1 2-amino-4-hydroxy-6-hydroxymethyldihydropteridine diphosphokinase [Microbacterium sp. MAH-37]